MVQTPLAGTDKCPLVDVTRFAAMSTLPAELAIARAPAVAVHPSGNVTTTFPVETSETCADTTLSAVMVNVPVDVMVRAPTNVTTPLGSLLAVMAIFLVAVVVVRSPENDTPATVLDTVMASAAVTASLKVTLPLVLSTPRAPVAVTGPASDTEPEPLTVRTPHPIVKPERLIASSPITLLPVGIVSAPLAVTVIAPLADVAMLLLRATAAPSRASAPAAVH
jgi:hypothetical protein